jgi:hypothetical protein
VYAEGWRMPAPTPRSQARSRSAKRLESRSLHPHAAPLRPRCPSSHDQCGYHNAEKDGYGIDRCNHKGHAAETTTDATLTRCLLVFVGEPSHTTGSLPKLNLLAGCKLLRLLEGGFVIDTFNELDA